MSSSAVKKLQQMIMRKLMPSGSFLAWFTTIIIQVINSEAFKKIDFMLFELSFVRFKDDLHL